MPDIAMCTSRDCPIAATCRRSEVSGTVPTRTAGGERQAWQGYHWRRDSRSDRVVCGGLWEVATTPALTEGRHG